jgi:trehalose/maltose hydrolase-like predicted phosphorylase
VTVKQADTILLAFPLGFEHATMTAAAIANDLAYYGNNTDTKNGPAMTWAMFHVNYVVLGSVFADRASFMLNQSFQLNAWPPFSTWMESPGGRGTPNFCTGAGGFLQAALNGYPGLRLTDTALALVSPQLPPGATRTVLRGLAYLGARFDVALDVEALTVSLRAGGAARAFALVDAAGAQHALAPGTPVSLPPQSVRIVAAGTAE